jgi:NAD(P)-dependent dehydrogenase (short-subunit alcohol dehydrogenase family)
VTVPVARSRPTGRVAWVTGAGKGIGRAVALRLVRDGWVVAASARTGADLDALVVAVGDGPGKVVPFVLDISDAAAATHVLDAIECDCGQVDLAILNAGIHEPIDGAAFDAAIMRRLVETNLMGTVHCLEPLIERFVDRRAGRIAVVASLAGYRGLPTASGYGATKAALINMCEALRAELLPRGVTLSVVTPGFVRTPLTDRNPFPMPFLVDADIAARRIVDGLATGRFEITFPRRLAYLMKLLRILPYGLFFAVTRRLRPADGD